MFLTVGNYTPQLTFGCKLPEHNPAKHIFPVMLQRDVFCAMCMFENYCLAARYSSLTTCLNSIKCGKGQLSYAVCSFVRLGFCILVTLLSEVETTLIGPIIERQKTSVSCLAYIPTGYIYVDTEFGDRVIFFPVRSTSQTVLWASAHEIRLFESSR